MTFAHVILPRVPMTHLCYYRCLLQFPQNCSGGGRRQRRTEIKIDYHSYSHERFSNASCAKRAADT